MLGGGVLFLGDKQWNFQIWDTREAFASVSREDFCHFAAVQCL